MATLSSDVTAGQDIKLDYALTLSVVVTAGYAFEVEIRLYSDTTLLNTRALSVVATDAGTQEYPIADTFVDTAAATATVPYEVRVIFLTETNVTSADAINRNLNAILFA